jgi:RND family efflux transporter MFP subunit
MVAYATSRSRYSQEEIREGAAVRERQKILSLPNLDMMQVKTSIHESVLDQVKPEQQATIRVDAFPDRVYQGTVQSVAVLPDQGSWFSPDTKVYETIITIDEKVERLKPGMTAVVEIDVDLLEDVLSVPVQAIVQVKDETSCFVDMDGQPQRRPIALGRTNDKFVEVTHGLQEGDRVVLNPMAIVDDSEEPEGDNEEQEIGNEAADTPTEAQEAKTEETSAESPRPARKPAQGKTRQQRKPSAKP